MATCRGCQQAIAWAKIGGKWRPHNDDGTEHACGFKAPRGRAPAVSAGIKVTGKHYQASCGKCDTMPWEVCACSALLVK